jgi:drug/metabolite transporter (DMT)-like permease
MPRHNDLFLAMLYAGIAGGVAIDQLISRRRLPSWRWVLLLGALAAAGSVVGMFFLIRASVLPAVVVFTANSVSSIVSTAVLATVLLGEKRTWSWYAALACGILSVLLANGRAIAEYLWVAV